MCKVNFKMRRRSSRSRAHDGFAQAHAAQPHAPFVRMVLDLPESEATALLVHAAARARVLCEFSAVQDLTRHTTCDGANALALLSALERLRQQLIRVTNV